MIKKSIKLFFELLFLLLIIFCVLFNKLVIYGIQQGAGQLSMVMESRPVEEVLNDASFPDSLKQKLNLIAEIKKYAMDSIGIRPSKN